MPISFTNDSSTQQGGTFTAGSIFYSNVNQLTLNNTSNTLKTFIDNKQDTLTASTVLLGNGGSLTNINWNNITQNKPSSFQADWNSTVINKPSSFQADWNSTIINKPSVFPPDTSVYTKTSTDTLLNAKQPLLTSTTTLSGIGSNLTLINYNNITNAPNLSGYATTSSLSSYQLLLTSTTTLSGIGSNLTLINYNTLSNLPNLSGYATISSLSGYQLFLTASTTLTGIGSNLTLINYNTLSNLPNLTQYITASTTGLTNYSTTTATNSAISTALTPYLTSATAGTTYATISSLSTKENTLTFNAPLTRTTNTISLDLSSYDTITARNTALGSYLALSGGTLTGTLTGTTINATTFNEGGMALSSKYLSSASLANYVLKAGDTMTGTLNGTTINCTGNININSQIIYNYLFNNTGGTHGDTQDFNAITTAGYKYVQNNINSPTTAYNQYYSWLIGIGINYPVTGANSYSCQFAVPRGTPRLYMRYNEFNSWGSWGGVIAASADALTAGDKTITGNLTIGGTLTLPNGIWHNSADGVNRIWYDTNGRTYFHQGGNTGYTFRNTAQGDIFTIDNSGNTVANGNVSIAGTTTTNNTLTIVPNSTTRDGINLYCYPTGINNANGQTNSVNMNVVCNTTTLGKGTFLNAVVADGFNGIDTIITLASTSGANSGYYNASRMILDGSYNLNAGRGTYASYIHWQSQIPTGSGWTTNMELYTNSTVSGGTNITTVLNVIGFVKSFGVTLTSSSNIKEKVRDIYDPLDLINKFQGKHYHNTLTGQKDFGLIAEDVEQICPCLTARYKDSGVDIGVKYMNLTAVLVEAIKAQQDQINRLTNILITSNIITPF